MPVKPKGALYILRDRVQIYVPGLTSIAEMRFVPEAIRELDIINHDMFANLIKVFVTNAKIPPSTLIMVIADSASFMKDFLQQPPPPPPAPGQPQKPQPAPIPIDELENQAKDFFNFVPYEEVASKIIPLKNGIRAYGTNKELLESLKIALEANGFTVSAALPAFAFGPEVSAKPVMDGAVATAIITKADSLIKIYNLLNQPAPMLELEKNKNTPEAAEEDFTEQNWTPEKPKSHLIPLLALLGFLIIVLIIVAWMQFGPSSQQPAPAPTLQPAVQSTNTTVSTPTQSNASAPQSETQDLTVQITNAAASPSALAALQEALEKSGLKNITVQTQRSVAATQSTVTFSKNVDNTTRTTVVNQIQQLSSNVKVLDRTDATVDISIILAK